MIQKIWNTHYVGQPLYYDVLTLITKNNNKSFPSTLYNRCYIYTYTHTHTSIYVSKREPGYFSKTVFWVTQQHAAFNIKVFNIWYIIILPIFWKASWINFKICKSNYPLDNELQFHLIPSWCLYISCLLQSCNDIYCISHHKCLTNWHWVSLRFLLACSQTPWKFLGFYRTEDTFWPDFLHIKDGYMQDFYQCYSSFISICPRMGKFPNVCLSWRSNCM